jgi:hypothetical protein
LRRHDEAAELSAADQWQRDRLDVAIALLTEHPSAGALEAEAWPSELRRGVLRRVPYVVWYATAPSTAAADVWPLRLLHSRQQQSPAPSWPPTLERRTTRRR